MKPWDRILLSLLARRLRRVPALADAVYEATVLAVREELARRQKFEAEEFKKFQREIGRNVVVQQNRGEQLN